MSRENESVSLQALKNNDRAAVLSLSNGLVNRGFALVRLDESTDSDLLRNALINFQELGEFRFPPVGKQVKYQSEHKMCFKILFEVTRHCLKALLEGNPSFLASGTRLFSALKESFAPNFVVFGPDGENNFPFTQEKEAFSTSFFNIFNYDHGLLNAHRDRCLVTAIFVNQQRQGSGAKSALWIKGSDGSWSNTDALVADNEVVILLGEEFQELAKSVGLPFWAAEHCIRVDPHGPAIARAHHRPDPDTLKIGNRISAAFVLSN